MLNLPILGILWKILHLFEPDSSPFIFDWNNSRPRLGHWGPRSCPSQMTMRGPSGTFSGILQASPTEPGFLNGKSQLPKRAKTRSAQNIFFGFLKISNLECASASLFPQKLGKPPGVLADLVPCGNSHLTTEPILGCLRIKTSL